MSKINKTIKWVDLHPRAERLLLDANTGIINQSEDAQIAHINAFYKKADASIVAHKRGTSGRTKVGAHGTMSPLTLQNHAINLLHGVASRLANSNHIPNLSIRDEATRIMRVVDALKNPSARNCDALVKAQLTKGTSRVYMTPEQRAADELERQARNWAARDRRQGKPHIPQGERVNILRRERDEARARALVVDEFGHIAGLKPKPKTRLCRVASGKLGERVK